MSNYQMEGIYAQDIVLWESGIEVYYAREERAITGVAGDELEPGTVLTADAVATVAASVDGILLSKLVYQEGETSKQAVVLVRNSVVNADNLVLGALDAAAVAAQLATMGIIARNEPAVQGLS